MFTKSLLTRLPLTGVLLSVTLALSGTAHAACGTAAGVGASTKPSANLCSTGNNASTVMGTGPWTWACSGSGAAAKCTTPLVSNGACGAANGLSFDQMPTSGLCATGTVTASTVSIGTSVAGTVYLPGTAASNGSPQFSTSTTAAGIPSVPSNVAGNATATATTNPVGQSTKWSWGCAGAGGTTASCSATSNSVNFAPSAGYCNSPSSSTSCISFSSSHGYYYLNSSPGQVYTVFLQPFNTSGLTHVQPGVNAIGPIDSLTGNTVGQTNYTEWVNLNPAVFPKSMSFGFDYPSIVGDFGVWNFSAIDYGNYNDTAVQDFAVNARALSAITNLTETHNLSFAGNLTGYDVIDDIFLLTGAPGATPPAKNCEIEVFLHTPVVSQNYINSVTQKGNVTFSGITWQVAVNTTATPKDILLTPVGYADVPNTTIDFNAMFAALEGLSLIQNTWYFPGFGMGVEVAEDNGNETSRNAGTVTVNNFAVSYSN